MKQPSKARRRITLLWFPRLTRVVPVQFKIPGTIARRWKLIESSLYWLTNKDHTDRLRRKLTEKLLNLKPVYNKMRPKHIQPPRIYGLPETHKSSILLRPIVSYVNTFAYDLSAYLADILAPLTGSLTTRLRIQLILCLLETKKR